MSRPRGSDRKRHAAEDDKAPSIFTAGQLVHAAPSAFGNFEGVAQGMVQGVDEFGRVVSLYG